MLLGEILGVALGALRANKLRSLLTMLGIVIGVAAVIAMVALGRGAQMAVNERINVETWYSGVAFYTRLLGEL